MMKNEHVKTILNQRRKCGYSMKSQGVGNQSKKIFHINSTNTSASVFPAELSTDDYNRFFPNDECQLKNKEASVGKNGDMVNNTNPHSQKNNAAKWRSSQGSGWGSGTPAQWSGHQSSSTQATINTKLNDDGLVEKQKIKINKLGKKCETFQDSIAEKDKRIKELSKTLKETEVLNGHLISEKDNLTIKFRMDKEKIDRDLRADFEDKEHEFFEEKGKLERKINNLERKLIELEEKEKKGCWMQRCSVKRKQGAY